MDVVAGARRALASLGDSCRAKRRKKEEKEEKKGKQEIQKKGKKEKEKRSRNISRHIYIYIFG